MKLGSGLATRESLVKAALTLFAQQGVELTTVQAIADRAGTTKGAFYHYFKNKDEVLEDIHTRFVERELGTLQDIVGQNVSAVEQLKRVIEELVANHDTYGEEIAVFNRERQYLLMDPRFDGVRAQRSQVEQTIDGVIARGVETGEFGPLPSVRLATFAILGMTAWLSQWYEPGGKMSARDVGRMYADMIVDGLRGGAR